MLARLRPFGIVAMAVTALLIAAIFLGRESDLPAPSRTSAPSGSAQPVTPQASFDSRPAPKIGPATTVFKVETTDPVVFLTIDDGAHRDPAMAEILKRNGIKATLFLTDHYVRQDPEFFRKLAADTGSVIENHTASHPNLRGKPLGEQVAEIGPVADRFAQVFGRRPTLFRAPFGNTDENTLQAAGEAGAKHVVNWGSEVSNGKIKFSGPKEFRPGSIVLMHFRATFEADVNAFMAQARANGLTPALLTDYLK